MNSIADAFAIVVSVPRLSSQVQVPAAGPLVAEVGAVRLEPVAVKFGATVVSDTLSIVPYLHFDISKRFFDVLIILTIVTAMWSLTLSQRAATIACKFVAVDKFAPVRSASH